MPTPGRRRPNLEIQIHSSDIQRGVRYLFLSRRHLALVAVGCALYLGFMGVSAWVAPDVLATLLSRREYRSMLDTRERLGERLEALEGRLGELGGRARTLNLRVNKIYLAYGLDHDDSIGQGGYPFEPRPVPDSIYRDQIARAAQAEAELQEQARVLEAFLKEIHSFEAANREQLQWTPSLSPMRGDGFVLTSPYGNRRSPFTKALDFHAGIDLAAPVGTPIYAPADGRVNFAGRFPLRQSVSWWRYGNLISIAHGDQFVSIYGHCEDLRVRKGERVKQGEVIATVGNTGWSTNPHLHYEIRRLDQEGNLRPVDPRIYILDHRWRDEEQVLVRARSAPKAQEYEPLPRTIRR